MSQSYHGLAKKSTILISIVITFFTHSVVWARVPNDTEYTNQAGMWNQIYAPEAWDQNTGSAQVVVATIDTGADIGHQDLSGNIWINQGEVIGNGVDDDRNGYVDDMNGWNFVEGNNSVHTPVGQGGEDSNAVNHGTIVAGLIGAIGNNNYGGVGVNWDVKLMPIRAMDNQGSGSYESIGQAVEYAVDNGAHVISMSFVGNDNVVDLADVLRRAYDRSVVIVAAAGNERRSGQGSLKEIPRYPICYDAGSTDNWILGVSSVDASDRLSSFADFGNCIDVVAPGENIYSIERYDPLFGYNKMFGGPWRGTSFAAPLVAGAAALIKSVRPEWGADKIISTIIENSDSVDSLNPEYAGQLGRGRLNIGRAVVAAVNAIPPFTPPTALYSIRGSNVVRYNPENRTEQVVSYITEGELKDIAVMEEADGLQSQILLLFRRGNYYYVKIVAPNGSTIREFAVGSAAGSRSKSVKELRVAVPYQVMPAFVVREYDSQSKKSKFIRYTLNGQKEQEFTQNGDINQWNTSIDGNVLYATLARNRLQIVKRDWSGTRLQNWSTNGVQGLHDLATGPILNLSDEQAVVLFNRNNQVWRVIVDMGNGSFTSESMGRVIPKVRWRTVVTPARQRFSAGVLSYHSGGGEFDLSDGRERVWQTLAVPSLKAALRYAVAFK